MVLPESPRTRGAEGATRPETLRHPNGRNLRTLESGPRGPTEGERNREGPVPNLSGFRTEGRRALGSAAPFFVAGNRIGITDGTTDTAS